MNNDVGMPNGDVVYYQQNVGGVTDQKVVYASVPSDTTQPQNNLSQPVQTHLPGYGSGTCFISKGNGNFVVYEKNLIGEVITLIGVVFLFFPCIPPLFITGIVMMSVSICCLRKGIVTFKDNSRILEIEKRGAGVINCLCPGEQANFCARYDDIRDFVVIVSSGVRITEQEPAASVYASLKNGSNLIMTPPKPLMQAQQRAKEYKEFLIQRVGTT